VVPAIVVIVTHSKYSRDITVFHPPSALSLLRLRLLLLLLSTLSPPWLLTMTSEDG
jgi:hypothetical protein